MAIQNQFWYYFACVVFRYFPKERVIHGVGWPLKCIDVQLKMAFNLNLVFLSANLYNVHKYLFK